MALTITSRGTGTHNTGATTLVPGGRNATLAVGSLGVLCMALDNAGANGNTLIAPDSWTDAKGNVWTLRQNALYDNGAASAGIEMAIYTAPITVALLTTDAGTMTWKTGVSPVAKAWTWYEVIPPANAEAVYSTGSTIAGATAANAQVVTASVRVGDGVIAGYFSENVNAVTQDSDSTNGTWTAQQTATVGTTTAGVRIATQQKVQTTAASTQTYDATVVSQDRIAGYIMVLQQHTASVSQTLTGGGVETHASTAAHNAVITVTGGGVHVQARTAAHNAVITDTGGGVATVARAKGGVSAVPSVTVATVQNGSPSQNEIQQITVTATAGTWTLDGPPPLSFTIAGMAWDISDIGLQSSIDDYWDDSVTKVGSVYTVEFVGVAGLTDFPQMVASGSLSLVGGGVLVEDYTFVSVENHDATFSATGGGVNTLSPVAGRITAPTLVGGGVAAAALTTNRNDAHAATGGGVEGNDATSARSSAFADTGGGIVSPSTAAARAGAAAMSGGGVLVAALASGHFAEEAFTGGGILTYFYGLGQDHPATFQLHGGGVLVADVTHARLVEMVLTGAGITALDAISGRMVAFALTASGRVTVTTSTPLPETLPELDDVGLIITPSRVGVEVAAMVGLGVET